MVYKKLTLDTKGSCFLCLARASFSSHSDSGDGQTEKCQLTDQSLRNICHLLKINPYSVLVKSMEHDVEDIDNGPKAAISFGAFLANSEGTNVKYDFSASLCETCYTVTSKLASLFHDLEMIKMMTQYQLQKLHDILSKTPSTDEQNYELSQVKGDVEVKTRLMENLRQEIQHKSHSYLRRQSMEDPKVCLTRFDTDPDNTIEKQRKRLCTLSTGNATEYQDYRKDFPSTTKMCINIPTFRSLSTDDVSPASTESVDTEHSFNTQMYNGPHDDYENSPVLDLPQYKCLIPGDRCRCPFCGDLFSDSVFLADGIYYHLVVNHLNKIYACKNVTNLSEAAFQELCEQVIKNAIPVMSVQDSSQSTNSTGESQIYSCSECNKSYETLTCGTFHFVTDHFKIFEDKLIAGQHDNNQHSVFKEQTIKVHNTPMSLCSKMDKKAIFPVCQMPTNVTKQYHGQFNVSRDESSNNLPSGEYVPLQPTPTVTFPPVYHFNLNDFLGQKSSHQNCTFCNAVLYRSTQNIRRHVISFHPEKLFISSKLPQINEAIFIKLCQNVIENETMKGGRNVSNALICSNCTKTFTKKANLRYHCISSHFPLMAGKLVTLQRNYLEDNYSAIQHDIEPLVSPLPISTASSLDQQQWQMFMTIDQPKSTDNTPTTARYTSTFSTPSTTQVPVPNFSSGSIESNAAPSANITNVNSDMTWSNGSMTMSTTTNHDPDPIPLIHQVKTENGNFVDNVHDPATYNCPQVYNNAWLSQEESQNYYHDNPLPSHYQLEDNNYYQMAVNQMDHMPFPTWQRFSHSEGQNFNYNRSGVARQEEPSNNVQSTAAQYQHYHQ